MQYGVVLTISEYDKILNNINEAIKDLNEMKRFDIMAGTYSDRVNLRADKMLTDLHKAKDILSYGEDEE
jgi:hypothetical protein